MSTCEDGNAYDGALGIRISSIFVMFVGSWAGAWFPVFARRHQSMGVPDWAFFAAKYFGSGVIIATAFIHLLAPANAAWMNPCLRGAVSQYPWAEGIALMTVFALFVAEFMTMRYAKYGNEEHDTDREEESSGDAASGLPAGATAPRLPKTTSSDRATEVDGTIQGATSPGQQQQEEPHLSHTTEHVDNADVSPDWQKQGLVPESYSAQLTAVFILEFGVIFHSVFVGLTLAVAGEEFSTLYIVLVFHQTFEGLGLGSRLAAVPWPRSKRWTPYVLATAFGITTPIAIAIGLAVRQSWSPGSQTALIANGTFDAISAGVLLYTGLIELMAHEFMFSAEMRRAPIETVLAALGLMVGGAGLMALLGYWV